MSDTELKVTTPSDREIRMTRIFNAPRRLVFEAHSKPELLKRWLLGPPGWEMVVCKVAGKVGDSFRFEWRNTSSGHQFGIGGVCRDVVPPEREVHTEVMDGQPGEALVTSTFIEENGKTTLTLNILFESREIRDIALKSGMEHGVAASYDRLDGVLAPGAAGVATHGCA